MSRTIKKTEKRALGRGLNSLLGLDREESPRSRPKKIFPKKVVNKIPIKNKDLSPESGFVELSLSEIEPNPNQPRRVFKEQELKELTDSIQTQGLIQPIIVNKKTKDTGKYIIIAGERRWRASQRAGLKKIPVVIKDVDEKTTLEMALIENIQRHDLNPMEEAEAYSELLTKYKMTQAELATQIGKDRVTISNTIRLLKLSPKVRDMVSQGLLSLGHAKVLVSIENPLTQKKIADKVIGLNLSVRATENLLANKEKAESLEETPRESLIIKELSTELQRILGTKTQIKYSKGKGKIVIGFHNTNQFNQLVEKIRGMKS